MSSTAPGSNILGIAQNPLTNLGTGLNLGIINNWLRNIEDVFREAAARAGARTAAATPDSEVTHEVMRSLELNVQVSTKLKVMGIDLAVMGGIEVKRAPARRSSQGELPSPG